MKLQTLFWDTMVIAFVASSLVTLADDGKTPQAKALDTGNLAPKLAAPVVPEESKTPPAIVPQDGTVLLTPPPFGPFRPPGNHDNPIKFDPTLLAGHDEEVESLRNELANLRAQVAVLEEQVKTLKELNALLLKEIEGTQGKAGTTVPPGATSGDRKYQP